MAAGIVLVREAGGLVTDVSGGNQMFEKKSIAAGAPPIQRHLLQVLGLNAA